MLNKIAILIGMFMLAAGAAACSGNDDNATKTPSVQSQSGLSVAFALQAGQRVQDRAASSSTEQVQLHLAPRPHRKPFPKALAR